MFQEKLFGKAGYLFIAVAAILAWDTTVRASVVWYPDDYDGWAAAAGDIQTIAFNTLPDGSRSVAGTPITPDFNYTSQGVTFSSPVTVPFLIGFNEFSIAVDSSPSLDRNWIIGELVSTTHALAVSYPSFGILSIFDQQGELIDSRLNGAFGTAYLGVISDVPIASFTMDRNTSASALDDYYQGTIPEPAVLTLIVAGSICLLCGRRGRRSGSPTTEAPGEQS